MSSSELPQSFITIIIIIVTCVVVIVVLASIVVVVVIVCVVKAVRKQRTPNKQTSKELSSKEHSAEKDKGVYPVWGGSVGEEK